MKRRLLIGLAIFATLVFTALGIWQVERLGWKLDLIARVEGRIHAPPQPLGPAARWPTMGGKDDEYRRVTVTGEFLHDRETLVQALTKHGPGFWVLTPLRTTDGTVLVNRGFVPADRRDAATRRPGQGAGVMTVTGLLRASEPGGGFLRSNASAADRWYSRDVGAIASARGLDVTAPFFIDADGAPNPGGYPIGGLTVVQFRNSHFVYAVTWFALAALSALGAFLVLRDRRAR